MRGSIPKKDCQVLATPLPFDAEKARATIELAILGSLAWRGQTLRPQLIQISICISIVRHARGSSQSPQLGSNIYVMAIEYTGLIAFGSFPYSTGLGQRGR